MDKIEKLKRLGEEDFQIGEILLLDRCVEIVDKINELVEAYNQDRLNSQEQPERKTRVKKANNMIKKIEKAYGVDTGLKGDEELHEHLNKNGLSSLSELLKPEKANEDWKKIEREDWRVTLIRYFSDTENTTILGYRKSMKGLIDFIEGLLKEREQFTPEELEFISTLLTAFEVVAGKDWGIYKDTKEKIERLLSKESN